LPQIVGLSAADRIGNVAKEIFHLSGTPAGEGFPLRHLQMFRRASCLAGAD
jgi:hypothetical protein